MQELKAIEELWHVIAVGIGALIWLVRLEGRVNQGDKDHASNMKSIEVLTAKHEGLDSRLVSQMADVRESLARIEGALGVKRQD